jgi:hypothetical protein
MRILRKIERTIANKMLARGPAKEIRAVSFLGFLRLYGSMGTGFAQPKIKGE